jgi:aspartate ammonia-lyase
MRIEKDFLGSRKLPDETYYGIQTLRAVENFPVSGVRQGPEIIVSYACIKKAAAIANMKLGTLDEVRGKAIVRATGEIIDGKLADQFPIDIFQAGAGTSTNMNVNEVIANRALEILGRRRGDYAYLSPNDHVNLGQSTNDTFPSASHIAIASASKRLIKATYDLADTLDSKGKEFKNILKSGRTHLMDALPISLGDEFRAYGAAIERAAERIELRQGELRELPIGGTAVGTGANAHPKFRETVLQELSKLCRMSFIPPRDAFEAMQSRALMVAFSSSLKELSVELTRMANDLRLLNSGPTTGFSEIVLPAVQPGSSIMPGKVNPVMAECLNMIAFRVIANDSAVTMAAQAGQLELNVMTPIMTHSILESVNILSNFLPVFQKKCVEGIVVSRECCKDYLERNSSMATFLVPKIGYVKAAEVAKEAMRRRRPVVDIALERKLITKKEAKDLFDTEHLMPNRRR